MTEPEIDTCSLLLYALEKLERGQYRVQLRAIHDVPRAHLQQASELASSDEAGKFDMMFVFGNKDDVDMKRARILLEEGDLALVGMPNVEAMFILSKELVDSMLIGAALLRHGFGEN